MKRAWSLLRAGKRLSHGPYKPETMEAAEKLRCWGLAIIHIASGGVEEYILSPDGREIAQLQAAPKPKKALDPEVDVECEHCHGHGQVQAKSGNWYQCPRCRGFGWL